MAEYNLLSLSDQAPLSVAADNYNMLGGEKSWFDSVGEALTLGTKGAAYSAINSFLDTGRVVANWFGAELEMSDTYTELLDTDPETAAYYRENKNAVDLAGFLVGSIIPGSVGLKAFNVARGVGSGERFSRTLNLFSSTRDRATTAAIDAIKMGTPTIDSALRANKIRAMASGFGEQTLQSIVWETSVAATMGASPVLENADWVDIGVNIAIGGALGGAIGGVFDAFGMAGKFNKARAIADYKLRPYEAVTNLGKGDYTGGDRIIALIDSLDRVPLPAPSGAATEKVKQTFNNAMLESRKILVGMSGDAEVANSLFDTIYRLKFEKGMSNDDLYDYLAQAVRVERIGENANIQPLRLEKFFADRELKLADESQSWEILNPNTPLSTGRVGTVEEILDAPVGKNPAGVYINKTSAFKAGEDLFLDADGKMHINPQSKNLRRIAKEGGVGLKTVKEGPAKGQPAQVNLIVDLKTGEVSDTALSTIGDIVSSAEIKIKDGGKMLLAGEKSFLYSLAEGAAKSDLMGDDYLRAHARFVWAAERGIQKGDTIYSQDLAMMDMLLRKVQTAEPDDLKALFKQDISVISSDAPTVKLALEDIAQDLQGIVEEEKRKLALELATKPNMSADEMALRLNVPKSRIQDGLQKARSLDELSPDAAEYKSPRHARIIYDVGDPVTDPDGFIARGSAALQARLSRAKDAAATAFASYAKNQSRLFPEIDERFAQDVATQEGAGASFLGFTNSNYGSVGEMYEAVGVGTKMMIDERVRLVETQLADVMMDIAQKPEVAAELGALTNMLRASPEHYKYVVKTIGSGEDARYFHYLVTEDLANKADELLVQTPRGIGLVKGAEQFIPKGYESTPLNKWFRMGSDGMSTRDVPRGRYAIIQLENPTIQQWVQKNVAINDDRLVHHANWAAAQGLNKSIPTGRVYAPPIDTRKYKYIALVKEPKGNGASSSSTAALTATSEEQLSSLIAQAKSKGYEVYTKDDIKRWHEAKGDYDYNMNLTENSVDTALKREGILSNFFPEVQADRVLDDWMSWHRQQVSRQTRNFVELKYAQQFAELRALGQDFTALATSKVQNISNFLSDTAKNPYNDYIKTALNLSKASEYRLWMDANEKVEAFFDTAFQTARNLFPKAASGKMSWEEVNKQTQKYGLGQVYTNAAQYLEAQRILPPTPYLRNFISGVNGVLAATTLRLDFFNSLINIVSTPILMGAEVQSLRRKILDKETLRVLDDSMTMPLPGSDTKIPATTKLIYSAVNHYFSSDGAASLAKYKAAGVLPDLLTQHRNMMDELAFQPGASADALKAKLGKLVEKGSVLTGNKFAEEFTRFVSANVMDQLASKIPGLSEAEKLAYIRTFVNRVQGNYIAAQRPVVFQGVLGQAMGLFQTYQFNMMQQLFRHVSNGDGKTVAMLLGLQSSFFGMQGLPLFAAVNTHIIGNAPGNPTHTDAYLAIPRLVGEDVGNLLLYGGVSWASGTAAYTRGDINPRNISILPINPADWPAISGLTRFVSNVVNVGQKLGDGGNFVNTMLQGLEHNSISRPLAGFAQLAQGYSTTSQGSLIASTMEEGFIASAARLAGSKPLADSIALDAMYRNTAYKAKDVARTKQLGEAVKTAFIAGRSPSEEEINSFATQYAALGGDIKRFNAFLIDSAKNANTSVINQFAQKMNNPLARNMMEIMGGQPLPDFANRAPALGSSNPTGEPAIPSELGLE